MSVTIYIMRHGEAQSVAPSDALRQLTPNGQREATIAGESLRQQLAPFDLVLVSPYVRAQQTWQAVKHACGAATLELTLDDLVPEADPKQTHDLIDALLAQHQAKNVLLVSHMPLVSYLVSELTQSDTTPIFMTAAVAQMAYDSDKMRGDFLGML